jgi:hypothetical protein
MVHDEGKDALDNRGCGGVIGVKIVQPMGDEDIWREMP